MYKSRTGGHNKSSTKEKRNTYPPLFSKLRRENALGLIFWYDRKFLHSEETILKMPAFMRAPKQDDY